jgi:hypothetical protein
MFAAFARVCRERGVTDQELAEWVFSLGARWLHAHGVSATNIHLWIDRELGGNKLTPLIAAARAANDFGGRR